MVSLHVGALMHGFESSPHREIILPCVQIQQMQPDRKSRRSSDLTYFTHGAFMRDGVIARWSFDAWVRVLTASGDYPSLCPNPTDATRSEVTTLFRSNLFYSWCIYERWCHCTLEL